VGNLLPEDRIVVKSEIEGMVEALRFEESDSVKQGVTLANISTKEFQVRLEMAEADYRLARINFERDEQLSQRSLITQAQFDQSLARRDSARLAEQLADISLKKSIVRAPLKGAVKTKFVQLGEYVRKGDPIAEILDLSRIKVELNIPEREIIGLREGMEVDVESYAVKEIRLTGKITRIGLEADARNRSFPVEVTVNNSNNDLRPGMLARVTIRKASQDNQVVIPRNAIIERDNGRVVFLEDSGRAQQRLISTGISRSDRVQVVSGLAFGDRLIVEGHTKLTDGEPVNIR
jgi:membrane fusion protein (multidrug efflux system)